MARLVNSFKTEWHRLSQFEKSLVIIGVPILLAFGILYLVVAASVFPVIFFVRFIERLDN